MVRRIVVLSTVTLIFLLSCTASRVKKSAESQTVPSTQTKSAIEIWLLERRRSIAKPIPKGYLRYPHLGLKPRFGTSPVEIESVIHKEAAYWAGLKPGDIILAIDGKGVTDPIDLIRILESKTPSDTLSVQIQRLGENRIFQLKPKYYEIRQDVDVIRRILWEGKPCVITILPGEFSNTTISNPQELAEWKKGFQISLLSKTENSYLNDFNGFQGFSLVDRVRVRDVLGELDFGQTGYISEDARNKLGQILGSTHILFVNASTFSDKIMKTFRIIEIETGEVIASVMVESTK